MSQLERLEKDCSLTNTHQQSQCSTRRIQEFSGMGIQLRSIFGERIDRPYQRTCGPIPADAVSVRDDPR